MFSRLRRLAEASRLHSQSVIALTIRLDFFGHVSSHPQLAQAVTTHQIFVPPMTEKELRDAILLPADTVGLEMEEGLSMALVQHTMLAPGRLPLLQHALLELFRRKTDDHVMTFDAYEEIGGVEEALTQRAEKIYKDLSEPQKELARKIFIELVDIDEEEGRYTSRRVSRASLDDLDDPTEVETVPQHLSDEYARLCFY